MNYWVCNWKKIYIIINKTVIYGTFCKFLLIVTAGYLSLGIFSGFAIFLSFWIHWLLAFSLIFSKWNAWPRVSSHINKDKWTLCTEANNHISQMRRHPFNHQQSHFSPYFLYFDAFVSAFMWVLHHAVSYSFYSRFYNFGVLLLRKCALIQN